MAANYDKMTRAELIQELKKSRNSPKRQSQLHATIQELQVYQDQLHAQAQALIEVQRSLEESRDRYADLYDFSPIGYVTLSPAGSIHEINLTGVSLLGFSREQILRTPLLVYVIPEDRPRFLNHMMRCRNTGQPVQSEFHLRHKHGAPIPVEVLSRPAMSQTHGGLVYFTALTDLTQRHTDEVERQQLLLKEQAARTANDAKDRFLAVLSHELRTPLTPVLAALTALEKHDLVLSETKPLLNMIRRNVEMESRLIEDLLDITRISQNKLHLRPEQIDAYAILHDVFEMCSFDLEQKKINFIVELTARDHVVNADPMRLRQIVWNLLRNAIKFTPARGNITVRTSNQIPGQLLFDIMDNGQGIDPDLLQRLFKPFEQGGATGERHGGLGLGLAISKSLVEAHGGHITASSAGAGQGSIFRFTLPVVSPALLAEQKEHFNSRSNADRAALNSPPVPPLRILLIEDIPTLRVMQQILELEGHTIRAAGTVAEALQIAQTDKFDLILSDLGLPDGSGLDVIRQLAHVKDLKAIALSGFGTDADRQRSLDAGFVEHLTKPIDFASLQAAIRRISGMSTHSSGASRVSSPSHSSST